eukprot:TRINITY_DN4029_c0_g1_i2.p1 TRINITY_DN4029_c0_g1~~TRINITY_DN4029_c0_g1_i2.p1  ORF type:complete len:270 (-),score=50.49 TRINITY_DN4029_c0_g1_i2:77-886(-)
MNTRICYLRSMPLVQMSATCEREALPALQMSFESSSFVRVAHDPFRAVQKKFIWDERIGTIDNFQHALFMGCAILHFSGHGRPNGSLVFQRRDYHAVDLTPDKVRSLLDGVKPPSLVFLSACHSTKASAAFLEHKDIKHVIATTQEVGDETSVAFGQSFYRFLFEGCSVRQSFTQAQKASGCIDGDKFVLLPLKDKHDEVIFKPDELPDGEVEIHKVTSSSSADIPRNPVIGRNIELFEIFHEFGVSCHFLCCIFFCFFSHGRNCPLIH